MDEKKTNKNLLKTLWQLVKFGLVGISNTLVSYAIYNLFYFVLIKNVHVAIVMSFVISVLNAWVWQTLFVFKEQEDGEKRVWWWVLIKTYISYSFTGLFLAEILTIIWLKTIHIQDYLGSLMDWVNGFGIVNYGTTYDFAVAIAPFLNMVITIPLNFIINKFWAYKQGKKKGVQK